MAAQKLTAMLLAVAFIVVAFGTITIKAHPSCVQQCMPLCMNEVESATTSACEDACEQFCETQGAPPINIVPGRKDPKGDSSIDIPKSENKN